MFQCTIKSILVKFKYSFRLVQHFDMPPKKKRETRKEKICSTGQSSNAADSEIQKVTRFQHCQIEGLIVTKVDLDLVISFDARIFKCCLDDCVSMAVLSNLIPLIPEMIIGFFFDNELELFSLLLRQLSKDLDSQNMFSAAMKLLHELQTLAKVSKFICFSPYCM